MLVYNKDHKPTVFEQGLMLVRQPVIAIQRVGDRRMSAREQMDARLNSTTLHSMPPVPLFDDNYCVSLSSHVKFKKITSTVPQSEK